MHTKLYDKDMPSKIALVCNTFVYLLQWFTITIITKLLGRPQPQMYPPVALHQYTWVNRTF